MTIGLRDALICCFVASGDENDGVIIGNLTKSDVLICCLCSAKSECLYVEMDKKTEDAAKETPKCH